MSNLICPCCNENFRTKSELNDHLYFKTREDLKHNHFFFNELNQNDWVECQESNCNFRSSNLKNHLNNIHKIKVGNYSGNIYSENKKIELEELKRESRNKRFTYLCEVCNPPLAFQSERSFHLHLISSFDLGHNHYLYNDSNKDEWVECKECNMRKQFLSRHLTTDHNMTCEQYRIKHPFADIFAKKYKEGSYRNFIEAGAKNQKRHETRKSHRTIKCIVETCNEKFPSEEGLEKHIRKTEDKLHSSITYNDVNKSDWVECQVEVNGEKCGCRRSNLLKHIKTKHNLSAQQYYDKYKESVICLRLITLFKEFTIENSNRDVTGKNNPFYGKHHTDETKRQISQTLLSKRDKEEFKKIIKQLEESEKLENQVETIFEILSILK